MTDIIYYVNIKPSILKCRQFELHLGSKLVYGKIFIVETVEFMDVILENDKFIINMQFSDDQIKLFNEIIQYDKSLQVRRIFIKCAIDTSIKMDTLSDMFQDSNLYSIEFELINHNIHCTNKEHIYDVKNIINEIILNDPDTKIQIIFEYLALAWEYISEGHIMYGG